MNYYIDGEEHKGYIKGEKTDMAPFYSMMQSEEGDYDILGYGWGCHGFA